MKMGPEFECQTCEGTGIFPEESYLAVKAGIICKDCYGTGQTSREDVSPTQRTSFYHRKKRSGIEYVFASTRIPPSRTEHAILYEDFLQHGLMPKTFLR